eukprot:CFRG6551T1
MLYLLLFIITLVSIGSDAADFEYPTTTLRKLAFGSCSKHHLPQPVWPRVLEYDPQVWVWLGDAVYADKRNFAFNWQSTDVEVMQSTWDTQKNHDGYKQLVKHDTQIIGTWDDHDYGINDGGAEYVNKSLSQNQFLNFLDEPEDSIRWQREGVYASYGYGEGDKRVLVVLLDVRYHFEREIIDELNNRTIDDLLGEEQWGWLQQQLQDPAPLKIIGSGIQVIANTVVVDTWRRHRFSFRRLQKLIGDTQSRGVVFISGDVHFTEMSCCADQYCAAAGYPLYDLTSSGLTHACFGNWTMGVVCEFALTWLSWASHRVDEMHGQLNYGQISINWEEGTLNLTSVDVHNNNPFISNTIALDDLVPGASAGKIMNGCPTDRMRYWENNRFRFTLVLCMISCSLGIIAFIYVVAVVVRKTCCKSCYEANGTPKFQVHIDPREHALTALADDTLLAHADVDTTNEKEKND